MFDKVADTIGKGERMIAERLITKSSRIQIMNVTLVLCAVALLGLFDFAEMKFQWSLITSPEYYIQTAIKGFAYSMIFFSFSSDRTEKMKDTDLRYNNQKSYIDDVVALARPQKFNECLYQYNIEQKRIAWIEEVQAKLAKLERKATMKDMFAWKEYMKSEDKDTKGYRKYVRKRVFLEEMLDSKWIQENIEYLKVNCDVVYSCEITQGTIKKSKRQAPTKQSGSRERAKSSAFIICRTMIIACLGQSVVFEFFNSETWIGPVISLVFTIVLALSNAISGSYNGRVIFEDIESTKMQFRFERCKEYCEYELEKYNHKIFGK